MKRYERYKDSGVEWLGEVPEHWDILKGKRLFIKQNRPERVTDDTVTCFRDGQVTLRSNRRIDGFTNAIKEIGSQGVRNVDFVIHNMDAFAGAIGVSDSDGKSTPVYSVCTPLKPNRINAYYYSYLLRSLALNGLILSLAKGIRERSTDFRFSDFGELEYYVPHIEEQERIVAFLDERCEKIDKAVEQKERMIELLNERRQIIIQRAVTRGLNPDTPLRDSGIDWIGKIPSHWQVKRLKHLLIGKLQYGANESGIEYSENLPRYIRITDFNDGKLDEQTKLSLPIDKAKDYMLKDGDILFARSGATVGKTYLFRSDMTDNVCCYAGYLIKAEADLSQILSNYLYIFTNSAIFDIWKSFIFNKATIENIGADKYANLLVIVPPLDEQQAIADYLDGANEKIERAISLKRSEIDRLKEYRQTLINSAVTGKIKI